MPIDEYVGYNAGHHEYTGNNIQKLFQVGLGAYIFGFLIFVIIFLIAVIFLKYRKYNYISFDSCGNKCKNGNNCWSFFYDGNKNYCNLYNNVKIINNDSLRKGELYCKKFYAIQSDSPSASEIKQNNIFSCSDHKTGINYEPNFYYYDDMTRKMEKIDEGVNTDFIKYP